VLLVPPSQLCCMSPRGCVRLLHIYLSSYLESPLMTASSLASDETTNSSSLLACTRDEGITSIPSRGSHHHHHHHSLKEELVHRTRYHHCPLLSPPSASRSLLYSTASSIAKLDTSSRIRPCKRYR